MGITLYHRWLGRKLHTHSVFFLLFHRLCFCHHRLDTLCIKCTFCVLNFEYFQTYYIRHERSKKTHTHIEFFPSSNVEAKNGKFSSWSVRFSINDWIRTISKRFLFGSSFPLWPCSVCRQRLAMFRDDDHVAIKFENMKLTKMVCTMGSCYDQ